MNKLAFNLAQLKFRERDTRVAMFRFFKTLSGTVHEEEEEEEELQSEHGGETLSLTVWRKSLVVSCNGFTVIDSNGNLVYRVDSYGRHPQEVILMDGSGQTLLTMQRSKKLGVDRWSVYEEDLNEEGAKGSTRRSMKSICVVGKNNWISHMKPSSVIAKVSCRRSGGGIKKYVIEGSYRNRSCKVFDESRRVLAEIKRKETMKEGVYFGVEVFLLVVLPAFDPGLAMALVTLLDQMFS